MFESQRKKGPRSNKLLHEGNTQSPNLVSLSVVVSIKKGQKRETNNPTTSVHVVVFSRHRIKVKINDLQSASSIDL